MNEITDFYKGSAELCVLTITEIHLNASFPVNQLQINGLKLIHVVTELFLLLLLFCFFCTVLPDNVVITASFWFDLPQN